jgi:phenol hydroxylase P0 protein
LVLPRQAFRQFCENNRVQHMDAQMSEALDADARKWRYGETRDADEAVHHPTEQ